MRWFCLVLLAACASAAPSYRLPHGSPVPAAELIALGDGVFVARAWQQDEAGISSRNGLLVAKGERAVLIDTPETAHAADQIAQQARAHSLNIEARLITVGNGAGRQQLAGSELEYFPNGLGGFVVYVPSQRVLYAGDVVRARDVELGTPGESQLVPWRESLGRIAARFPDAQRIVPSQGEPGGRELLDHTRHLLSARISELSGTFGGG